MTNIEKLTQYLNTQASPRAFAEVLLSVAKPQKEVKPCDSQGN